MWHKDKRRCNEYNKDQLKRSKTNEKGGKEMQEKRTKQRTNRKGNSRSKKDKYKINKKIFNTGFALTFIMIALLVYTDGFSVLFRTWEISCPIESYKECNLHFENGTPLTLQPGETHKINEHTNNLIPIINWGSGIMLFLIFLVNHLLYNRHYKLTKKKLEKIIENEVKYWLRHPIWLINKYNKYAEKEKEK